MTSYNFLLGYLRLLFSLCSSNTDIMFRSIKIMSFKNIIYLVFLISTPEEFISTISGRIGRKNHSQFGGVPPGITPPSSSDCQLKANTMSCNNFIRV